MHDDDHHPTLELEVASADRVEHVWRTYWLPIIAPEGRLSIERLKGELFDAYFLVDNARNVYHHVTGGTTDDLTASAEGIIAMAERQVERRLNRLREKITTLEAEAREAGRTPGLRRQGQGGGER